MAVFSLFLCSETDLTLVFYIKFVAFSRLEDTPAAAFLQDPETSDSLFISTLNAFRWTFVGLELLMSFDCLDTFTVVADYSLLKLL